MTRKPKWKLSREQVKCLERADEMLTHIDDWRYELLRVDLLTDEARGKLAEMELCVRQYEEAVGIREADAGTGGCMTRRRIAKALMTRDQLIAAEIADRAYKAIEDLSTALFDNRWENEENQRIIGEITHLVAWYESTMCIVAEQGDQQ